MPSDEIRTKCQEAYEQEISDELWHEVTNTQIWKMTESPDLAVLLFLEHVRKGEMQKKYQAEKAEMEKKYQAEKAEKEKKYQTEMAEKEERIAELQTKLMNFEKQKQHQQGRKPLYVSGVSHAAKHSVYLSQTISGASGGRK
ncbi:hypothetical protein IV203_023806 [Nitzschia inconspicua]|uniref:Uncharacterized protein n=1 Tax=Nitzschia inconspicua TaxID=303405 RepID=A0A9K3KC57_9STRA|nr:hypothetical protein IV203_023806 [Nitzschia inconspicua]